MFRSKRPSLNQFVNTGHSILRIASHNPIYCREDTPLEDALDIMLQRHRRIPVLGNGGKVTGILSKTDILDYLGAGKKHKKYKGMQIPVRQVMTHDVRIMDSSATIGNAFAIFKIQNKGLYPITEKTRLKGIVSESDFVQQMHRPIKLKIKNIMTKKPISIKPNFTAHEAAVAMLKLGFKRLPVVKNSSLVGIITPFDILSHPGIRMKKAQVKDVMKRSPVTLRGNKDVYSAITIMNLKGIGGIPVVDYFNNLIGIVTERDILDLLI